MGRIVRYVAANHVRSIRRRRVEETDPARLESRHLPPEADPAGLSVGAAASLSAVEAHFDDQVLHALAELSAVARACLLLRTIEGLTYTKIADLLGIPEGTAMSHVYRARQQMRARLSEPAAAPRAAGRPASARSPAFAPEMAPQTAPVTT